MTIKNNGKSYVITINNTIDYNYIQEFLDFIKIQEKIGKSKATPTQIKNLSEMSQENWWKKNKSRFV